MVGRWRVHFYRDIPDYLQTRITFLPMPFKFIKEMKQGFVLHSVAAHFSNGMLPVALLYLLLFLPTGDPFFERTVIHLLVIVLLAVPVSFYSGIRDWKVKYKGAKAPVFQKKIRLSILLSVLCVAAVSIRVAAPEVMLRGGVLAWIYVAVLFAMLPTVVLLGHHGGKLAAGQRSERFR
jgi:hypothetical protein